MFANIQIRRYVHSRTNYKFNYNTRHTMRYAVINSFGQYALSTIGRMPYVDCQFTYDSLADALDIKSTHDKLFGFCTIELFDDMGVRLPRQTEIIPAGCLFDGNVGFTYNARRIIEMAWCYGRVPDDYEWATNDDVDTLVWESDEALEYLNQFVPDGHDIGWHDGDVIVSPLNEE